MQITVRKYKTAWYIYVNNSRYKTAFENSDEAYLSEEYKHFYNLINKL